MRVEINYFLVNLPFLACFPHLLMSWMVWVCTTFLLVKLTILLIDAGLLVNMLVQLLILLKLDPDQPLACHSTGPLLDRLPGPFLYVFALNSRMFLFLRGVVKCPILVFGKFTVILIISLFIKLSFIDIIIIVSGYRIVSL
jgi:hypothetical protein